MEQAPVTKTCRTCKEIKELELFEKDKKCKFGRKSLCKKCKYNYNSKNYQLYYKLGLKKPKEHKEQPVTKICRICKERKELDLFKLNKQSEFGRDNCCKKCHMCGYRINQKKIRESKKKYKDKQITNLGTVYLKGIICQKLNIPSSKVTDQQLQLQKESILLQREYEQLKQQLQ